MRAFTLTLGMLVVAVPLSGQAAAPADEKLPRYKDPATATIVSILCPGCGHGYSGERAKGGWLLAGGTIPMLAGAAASTCTETTVNDATFATCDHRPFYAGLMVSAFFWLYGIGDAADSAERMNLKNGHAPRERAAPVVGFDRRGALQLGLTIPSR